MVVVIVAAAAAAAGVVVRGGGGGGGGSLGAPARVIVKAGVTAYKQHQVLAASNSTRAGDVECARAAQVEVA